MKLKKLLALALAGVLMLALLTGCSGGGTEEDRLVAVGVADLFKGNSQNVEVSYSVPALTRTIRPAFTPDWLFSRSCKRLSLAADDLIILSQK